MSRCRGARGAYEAHSTGGAPGIHQTPFGREVEGVSELTRGDSLTVMRAAGFRFAVPMARVQRILSAAMPVALPGTTDESHSPLSHLRVGAEFLPLVYGAAL